jgi:HSP20 family protein
MTLVQYKNRPASASFNNFIDDFFSNRPSLFRNDLTAPGLKQPVPVNIKENGQEYLLEVVAPGLKKEDFKIKLEQNLLTISAEGKTEAGKENEKQVRREYRFQPFKRSFTVDEKIDAENISAKYVNGILTLNLPKKEEVKEVPKQITIE